MIAVGEHPPSAARECLVPSRCLSGWFYLCLSRRPAGTGQNNKPPFSRGGHSVPAHQVSLCKGRNILGILCSITPHSHWGAGNVHIPEEPAEKCERSASATLFSSARRSKSLAALGQRSGRQTHPPTRDLPFPPYVGRRDGRFRNRHGGSLQGPDRPIVCLDLSILPGDAGQTNIRPYPPRRHHNQ